MCSYLFTNVYPCVWIFNTSAWALVVTCVIHGMRPMRRVESRYLFHVHTQQPGQQLPLSWPTTQTRQRSERQRWRLTTFILFTRCSLFTPPISSLRLLNLTTSNDHHLKFVFLLILAYWLHLLQMPIRVISDLLRRLVICKRSNLHMDLALKMQR